jgi:hypothetical protein
VVLVNPCKTRPYAHIKIAAPGECDGRHIPRILREPSMPKEKAKDLKGLNHEKQF